MNWARPFFGVFAGLVFLAPAARAQGLLNGGLTAPPQARVSAPAAPVSVKPGEAPPPEEPEDPAIAQMARGFGVVAPPTPTFLIETINRAKATTRAAALIARDWRAAAFLGASAADIVRAEQARGLYADINPDTAVVVIAQDGVINSVYSLRPLPPLPASAATAPVNLGGVAPPEAYVEGVSARPTVSSQGFDNGLGGITLRPPYFASDFGGGAPTPQIAAERVGMSL